MVSQDLFTRGQLTMLRNDCAAADWPVGVICAGLSPIMPRELGIAGYQGFTFGDATQARQLRYIAGGHGAAMDGADKQASIADFITGRKDTDPPLITDPTVWFELANKLAPFLFILAVVLFVALLWALLSMALWGGLLGITGALLGLMVLTFVFLRI